MESFIEMINQIISIIIILGGILLIPLILPTITGDFLSLATPNAFGQPVMFGSNDKGKGGSASDTTGNNNMKDYNIVSISTTTDTNNSSATTSNNLNETIPRITVVDINNSTYIASNEVDEDESERRISRAIRDRINDVIHTVVMGNATIISAATIINEFLDTSTTINNHTRLLEIITDQVEVALAEIRTVSQPANSPLEIHTDIDAVCSANNTTLAECNMNIRIR